MSSMRVRMLDAEGDYSFGQGTANFWINKAQGVAQNVETRLALIEGEWFLDLTEGTDWQEVIGYNTASLRDSVIKTRILTTDNVLQLVDYNSSSNSTRNFVVSGSILTPFDPNPVPFGPVTM